MQKKFVLNPDITQMYMGYGLQVLDDLLVDQPTVGDMIDIGEQKYYGLVSSLTAIPSDYISELFDIGINWEDLSDIELFARTISSVRPEDAKLFFPRMNITEFQPRLRNGTEVVLLNPATNMVLDEHMMKRIQRFLCTLHGIKKQPVRAGNKHTRQAMIDYDRDTKAFRRNEQPKSSLQTLISSMINSPEFKYKKSEILQMPVFEFMDNVARVQTRVSSDALTAAYYSGAIDTKKFNTEKLNWMRNLY